MTNANTSPRVAVLIPCFNEELTIADVVSEFRAVLPSADVYVFDNNSTDASVARAEGAHAHVVREPRPGKGHVVQAMFRQVDADVYVIVDGDRTYPSDRVASLIEPIVSGRADMVIGSRMHASARDGFSMPHLWGNRLAVFLSHVLFGVSVTDVLSGYRAVSRTLVQNVPLTSGGFQIETELTLKAINQGFRVIDVPVGLRRRPPGSHSKIRFIRDGCGIVMEMLALFAHRRRS